MLKGSFYNISVQEISAGKMEAALGFDVSHAIFGGHFPGQPVVPGVCMLQIVTELVEELAGSPVTLKNGQDLKFLHVIDPRIHTRVLAEIQLQPAAGGETGVQARFFSGDTVFFKFRGLYASAQTV